MTRIVPIREEDADSFWRCLDVVAREGRYLLMTEGPPLASTRAFVQGSIAAGDPQFVALDDLGNVVGWCDVKRSKQATVAHVGHLGMGVHPVYRGQGLGKELILATLRAAKERDIETVRLEVYVSNVRAQALYRGVGFVEEGRKVRGRKYCGIYEDILAMALHL